MPGAEMPSARIVVDRIEGDLAVVEIAGQIIDLPVGILPDGAREGSVLQLTIANGSDADGRERLARMQSASGISDDFTL